MYYGQLENRELTSEGRLQKLHTDDVSLPRSGYSASDWSCRKENLLQSEELPRSE